MYQENRFAMLARSKPAVAKELLKQAQGDVSTRWAMYEYLAARHLDHHNGNGHQQEQSESPQPVSQVQ